MQRFPEHEIIDEWKLGRPNVIYILESKLIEASLMEDWQKVDVLQKKLSYIENLDKTIKIGLLES